MSLNVHSISQPIAVAHLYVFPVKKIHPLFHFHSALWSLLPVMEDAYLPSSQTRKILQIPVITLHSFLPYWDWFLILLCWYKSEVAQWSLQRLYRKRICVCCFLNASSGVALQFGPKSNTRDFLMLHLKLLGAFSNRAINQGSFLSCPEGKENRDLNAKFSFQLRQDIVSGLKVFWALVLESFKFISHKSMLTQKFSEFRGNNWSLNSC